jgi:Zn-dependent peptidase ImmA (M78 family)
MNKIKPEILENFATKFRVENGLSLTEPIVLKSLLQKLNILTVFRPLSDNFYGLSLRSKDNKRFMLINKNRTMGRQNFTIAHELYHLFFEDDLTPRICNKESVNHPSEINANYFASAFLIPKEGLLKELSNEEIQLKNLSLAKVIYLEQYYSVSRTSILIRLKQLGFISQKLFEDYKSLPVKESARQYGYDTSLYEKTSGNLIIGSYGEKAKLLFDLGKISEGHYQEIINTIYNE